MALAPAFSSGQKTPSASSAFVGNHACARCHAQITDSYSRTSMALASGPAAQNLSSADFLHPASGVHYRIYEENGRAWLSFDRPGDALVKGKRELLYYIGSGRRGRTYLFSTNGFLFESPINWYTKKAVWDMAPAYRDVREMPLNLPAYPSCMACHTSQMRPPQPGTDNRYSTPAFLHDGVSCERCHGPGADHVNGGAIVNPAKLSPERRDQVCMQCHLEGAAAIQRPGKHLYDYQAGQNLSDFVRYYVVADTHNPSLGAVSQVEALTQSICKKKSGDAMSCTSCHDPHYSPPSNQRIAFHRQKCLACHDTTFGAKHHADQPDCTACHMPAIQSTDVAHTQVTDHRIPMRPSTDPPFRSTTSNSPRLVLFPDRSNGDERDLALAWESLAEGNMPSVKPEAERLLRRAIKTAPDDKSLLSGLAYIELQKGQAARAQLLYEHALSIDPMLADAAVNLGVISAHQGDARRALSLWMPVFDRNPARSEIGLNIASTWCAAGKLDRAQDAVLRVLEFNPDFEPAKEMLRSLGRTPPGCGK
jgi:predicted CXXCH cytochrome family protein